MIYDIHTEMFCNFLAWGSQRQWYQKHTPCEVEHDQTY